MRAPARSTLLIQRVSQTHHFDARGGVTRKSGDSVCLLVHALGVALKLVETSVNDQAQIS